MTSSNVITRTVSDADSIVSALNTTNSNLSLIEADTNNLGTINTNIADIETLLTTTNTKLDTIIENTAEPIRFSNATALYNDSSATEDLTAGGDFRMLNGTGVTMFIHEISINLGSASTDVNVYQHDSHPFNSSSLGANRVRIEVQDDSSVTKNTIHSFEIFWQETLARGWRVENLNSLVSGTWYQTRIYYTFPQPIAIPDGWKLNLECTTSWESYIDYAECMVLRSWDNVNV